MEDGRPGLVGWLRTKEKVEGMTRTTSLETRDEINPSMGYLCNNQFVYEFHNDRKWKHCKGKRKSKNRRVG